MKHEFCFQNKTSKTSIPNAANSTVFHSLKWINIWLKNNKKKKKGYQTCVNAYWAFSTIAMGSVPSCKASIWLIDYLDMVIVKLPQPNGVFFCSHCGNSFIKIVPTQQKRRDYASVYRRNGNGHVSPFIITLLKITNILNNLILDSIMAVNYSRYWAVAGKSKREKGFLAWLRGWVVFGENRANISNRASTDGLVDA